MDRMVVFKHSLEKFSSVIKLNSTHLAIEQINRL